MAQNRPNLAQIIEESEPVRLFPGHELSVQSRVTCALLACAQTVPDFCTVLFDQADAKFTKKSKVACFSDPVFYHRKSARWINPQGLVVAGGKVNPWTALVQCTVSGEKLSQEDFEILIDVAKSYSIPAVLLISNDLSIETVKTWNKRQPKNGVVVHHLPWMKLITLTMRQVEAQAVPEHRTLLTELMRYFRDPGAGLLSPVIMHQAWSAVCRSAESGPESLPNMADLNQAVDDWFYLLHHIAFRMSLLLGHAVSLEQGVDEAQAVHKKNAVNQLHSEHTLCAELYVPHALPIKMCADLNRKTISAGMRINAPSDRKLPSIITWLLRQVAKCRGTDLIVTAYWPNGKETQTTLALLRKDKNALNIEEKLAPVEFELMKVWNTHERMHDSRHFVEDAETILPDFYIEVGQHLAPWIPSAPIVVNEVPVVKKIAKRLLVD